MAVFGLNPSFAHPENGMTLSDMEASAKVADELDEVIIYRSTGPWSQRWIDRGYPTKNFHVKGKSSDWGPQAGFVPHLGIYSKVGHDSTKAADGTKANLDGMAHNYAAKTQLVLMWEEIKQQLDKREESPPRQAIHKMEQVAETKDWFLLARRSGDNREFAFRAVYRERDRNYAIFVYPSRMGTNLKRLIFETPEPLEVMTSSEVGAHNKPMTGDYDLMAVCPRWGNYGSKSVAEISKPGLHFSGKGLQAGLSFKAGTNLDKVLDMRSNTGARPKDGSTKETFQGLTKKDGGKLDEHGDMGNLTPRILRCINRLNASMRGGNSAFRRVHHNAESHRNAIFAALTAAEMQKGDGLPLTVFQPRVLLAPASPVRNYQIVSTLETLDEFKEYAKLLSAAGYFVPRNWTWGMSIRDGFR